MQAELQLSKDGPSSSGTTRQSDGEVSKRNSTADTDLKSCIIEFMRDRPFLWNREDPHYKDHKRRELEFQAFSNKIGQPIQEIKRVWHVLRTNFFRAHKLLLDRPANHLQNGNATVKSEAAGGAESGPKLWKYYLAMEYVLEGTQIASTSNSTCTTPSSTSMTVANVGNDSNHTNTNLNNSTNQSDNNNTTSNKETASATPNTRQTRSCRSEDPPASSLSLNLNNNNNHHSLKGVKRKPTRNYRTSAASSNASLRYQQTNQNNISNNNLNLNSSLNSSFNSSMNNNSMSLSAHDRSLAFHNDSSSMDMSDADYLYARSLNSTLKRFDPTTKEIIKLKFQEIIVSYMQQQQQHQQQQQQQNQNHHHHNNHNHPHPQYHQPDQQILAIQYPHYTTTTTTITNNNNVNIKQQPQQRMSSGDDTLSEMEIDERDKKPIESNNNNRIIGNSSGSTNNNNIKPNNIAVSPQQPQAPQTNNEAASKVSLANAHKTKVESSTTTAASGSGVNESGGQNSKSSGGTGSNIVVQMESKPSTIA